MNVNNKRVVIVSLFAAGSLLLDFFRLLWYVNSKSLYSEIFYFVVVLYLVNSHIENKKKYEYKWFFTALLAGNVTLSISNIMDAVRATKIKWEYKFNMYHHLPENLRQALLNCQYGEIEKNIYSNSELGSLHYLVWLCIMPMLFCVIIDNINKQQ